MADVAELADALDSKSSIRKDVWVRPPPSAPSKFAEFIADRRSAECSAVHVHDLEIRLGQFSKAFELPIMAVSAPLVQQRIYGLKNQKTRRAAAAHTKENMLRQIVSLFNFARRQKYVPAELALELSEISTPKKRRAPDEMRALLAAADELVM